MAIVIGALMSSRKRLLIDLEKEKKKNKLLNKEISNLTSTLQNTIKTKESFLLNISHELRNSLSIINGNIQLALRDIFIPKVKYYLENAKICSDLVLYLMNNIMDSAKIQRSEFQINPLSVNTSCFVQNLWGTSKVLITKKNLKGAMFISKDIPENIIIDDLRVMQIAYNLIGNSTKFTSSGSVIIILNWIDSETINDDDYLPIEEAMIRDNICKKSWTLEKELVSSYSNSDCIFEEKSKELKVYTMEEMIKTMKSISMMKNYYKLTFDHVPDNLKLASQKNQQCKKRKGFLKIEVYDSGPGIPPDKIKDLFKEFSQLGSESQKSKGTGLGLWISRNLCLKMKGDLKAFSDGLNGSVFVANIKCF